MDFEIEIVASTGLLHLVLFRLFLLLCVWDFSLLFSVNLMLVHTKNEQQ